MAVTSIPKLTQRGRSKVPFAKVKYRSEMHCIGNCIKIQCNFQSFFKSRIENVKRKYFLDQYIKLFEINSLQLVYLTL